MRHFEISTWESIRNPKPCDNLEMTDRTVKLMKIGTRGGMNCMCREHFKPHSLSSAWGQTIYGESNDTITFDLESP